ncbi:MAG UNVERIFIED_CONTAM: universal stress protein [Microcystis novacekii LVE1205-3]
MVALDKSSSADLALDLAIYLLRDYPSAELIPAAVNPDLKPEFAPTSPKEMEENPILAPAVAKVKRMNIPYRCLVTGGKPGEQLCKLVDDYNVDSLNVGFARSPSFRGQESTRFDRLLGTSLSDYVRVNVNCPVLLARKEGI